MGKGVKKGRGKPPQRREEEATSTSSSHDEGEQPLAARKCIIAHSKCAVLVMKSQKQTNPLRCVPILTGTAGPKKKRARPSNESPPNKKVKTEVSAILQQGGFC